MRYLIMPVVIGCVAQQDKPIENLEEETLYCADGTYSATFSVWSDRPEEESFTEEEPLCENTVEVYVDGDVIQTSFDCTFQRGGQERILEYELSGLRDEESSYLGAVWFTRGNGEVVEASFDGTCTRGAPISLSLSWFLDFESPGGLRSHSAKITNEEGS